MRSVSKVLTFIGILWSTASFAALNPTDRDITINMPLLNGEMRLGEVNMKISREDVISVDAARFIDLIQSGLSTEALLPLQKKANEAEYFEQQWLKSQGFELAYNAAKLNLSINWPSSYLKVSRLGKANKRESFSNASPPSQTSAYVNVYAGAREQRSTDSLSRSHSAAFTGAVSLPAFRHLTMEGDAHLNQENQLIRDGNRLVYYDLKNYKRWRAGDINTAGISYLGSTSVLGISVDYGRSVDRIKRSVSLTTGRKSFFLERDSIVRIFINDRLDRTLNLQAGPYELDQLAANPGSNQVLVEVEDETGVREMMRFDIYSDASLLKSGEVAFASSAGVVSGRDGDEILYNGNSIFSGYYRYGASDRTTVAGFTELTRESGKLGGSIQRGLSPGKISIEAAASGAKGIDSGFAANAGWNYPLQNGFGLERYKNAQLLVGARYQTTGYDRLAESPEGKKQADLHVGFFQTINPNWNLGLNFNAELDESETAEKAGITLGFRNRAFSASMKIEAETGEDKDLRSELRIAYKFDQRTAMRAQTRFRDGSDVNYNVRSIRKGVGSWAVNADIQSDREEQKSMGVSLHHIANRANLAAAYHGDLENQSGESSNQRSLSAGMAIAYAGGKVALGRPIQDSFAILSAHPNLDKRTVYAERKANGEYQAKSGILGPALYTQMQNGQEAKISYEVNELPLGYDLGTAVSELIPSYRSGFQQTVGSNNTITLVGRALTPDGSRVKLLTGTIEPVDSKHNPAAEKQVVFTNSDGRFSAQGLSPGKWRLILQGKRDNLEYTLIIPEDTIGLWRTGDLLPMSADIRNWSEAALEADANYNVSAGPDNRSDRLNKSSHESL